MQIAKSAIATAGQQHPLTYFGQVGNHRLFILIQQLSPHRHPQHNLVTIGTGTLFAHTRRAIFGKEMLLIAKIN